MKVRGGRGWVGAGHLTAGTLALVALAYAVLVIGPTSNAVAATTLPTSCSFDGPITRDSGWGDGVFGSPIEYHLDSDGSCSDSPAGLSGDRYPAHIAIESGWVMGDVCSSDPAQIAFSHLEFNGSLSYANGDWISVVADLSPFTPTGPVEIRASGADSVAAGTVTFSPGVKGVCDSDRFHLEWSAEVPCGVAHGLPLRPGTTVIDVGIGAEVPEAGGIDAYADSPLGGEVLSVRRQADGKVAVASCGSEVASLENANEPPPPEPAPEPGDPPPPEENPPPAGADATADPREDTRADSPRACKDRAFRVGPGMLPGVHSWYLNTSSLPSNIGTAAGREAIQQGMQTIPLARNTCDLPDTIDAQESYLGTTNLRANVGRRANSADQYCRAGDGTSVTDFGLSEGRWIGLFCGYRTPDGTRRLESDIRLNTRYRWSPTAGGSCSAEASVRAVIAHEAGHLFGLNDLNPKRHGNLTMSGELDELCSDRAYTLGRGDVLGLRHLGY